MVVDVDLTDWLTVVVDVNAPGQHDNRSSCIIVTRRRTVRSQISSYLPTRCMIISELKIAKQAYHFETLYIYMDSAKYENLNK